MNSAGSAGRSHAAGAQTMAPTKQARMKKVVGARDRRGLRSALVEAATDFAADASVTRATQLKLLNTTARLFPRGDLF
jgi:hypothetical protein